MERYLVISSDCHAGLPGEQYRDYLDPAYRDAFDTFLDERAAMETELVARGLRNEEFAEKWFDDNEEGLRGGWDAARRDQELDADGVAGEVIFPDADAVSGGASAPFGAGLGMSSDIPGDLLMAGARAHNRWLAELCATSPERRAGIAIVPILDDIDAAVAEIRRARESGLTGGILIPAMWRPHAPYHDPRYEPVWSVCEELAMAVHTHSGAAPKEEFGEYVGLYIAEVRFWAMRPLWFLLWSGVFERHPGLRFAVTECGSFWAADLLWTMDIAYDREHAAKKLGDQLTATLPRRPSEYFDRNCAIGSSNTRRRELARRHEIGIGNIMWGSDFPHPEGTWPHTRQFLRDAFWDIPVHDTARILGTNAAEFYAFDTTRLRSLADRIGPTPAELGQTEPHDDQWAELAAAGRPWLTGTEAIPVPQA